MSLLIGLGGSLLTIICLFLFYLTTSVPPPQTTAIPHAATLLALFRLPFALKLSPHH